MDKASYAAGPYRATKLWNEVTSQFRTSVPLRRHRAGLRTHARCFTAAEACDSLLAVLRAHAAFGHRVGRPQAAALLRKLLKNHVIEDVKGRWGSEDVHADDGRLYRFPSESPLKPACRRSPRGHRPRGASDGVGQDKQPREEKQQQQQRREDDDDDDEEEEGGVSPRQRPRLASAPCPVSGGSGRRGVTRVAAISGPPPRFLLQSADWRKRHSVAVSDGVAGLEAIGAAAGTCATFAPGSRHSVAAPEREAELRRKGTEPRGAGPSAARAAWPAAELRAEEAHKRDALERLRALLALRSLEGLLDPTLLHERHLLHNLRSVNRHGVVLLADGAEDLPSWVLSAMKCLATWPGGESSGPSYPGFERDVFRTVADYFQALPEPLLTFPLYGVVAYALSLTANAASASSSSSSSSTTSSSSSLSSIKASASRSEPSSLKRTVPTTSAILWRPPPPPPSSSAMMTSRRPPPQLLSARTSSRASVTAPSSAAAAKRPPPPISSCPANPRASKPPLSQPLSSRFPALSSSSSSSSPPSLPSSAAAAAAQSHRQPQPSSSRRTLPSFASTESLILDMSRCLASSEESDAGSDSDGCDGGGAGDFRGNGLYRAAGAVNLNSSLETEPQFQRSRSVRYNAGRAGGGGDDDGGGGAAPGVSVGGAGGVALGGMSGSGDISSGIVGGGGICRGGIGGGGASRENADPNVGRRELGDGHGTTTQVDVNTRVALALQLCCALLPPSSRRCLQLLVRVVVRVAHNEQLPPLQPPMDNRSLMLESLWRCVLRPRDPSRLDEVLCRRALDFIARHHAVVLQPPAHLLTAPQPRAAPDPGCEPPLRPSHWFCRQISMSEFREQGQSESRAALLTLLDGLLEDGRMHQREKQRKIKQFRKAYPDVYRSRFPDTGCSPGPSKAPRRPPLISLKGALPNPFNRVRF